MRAIYSTLFAILYLIHGMNFSSTIAYVAMNIISIIFNYSSIALAIALIILFGLSFFSFSNNFNSEVQQNLRLSAILLISYLGFEFIMLFLVNVIYLYLFPITLQSRMIFYIITNIISTALLLSAIVFMNFTIQKTHKFGLNSKINLTSAYIVIIIGIVKAIYYIIYLVYNLPYYSYTIVLVSYSIAIIICFIEYILYLNNFNITKIPEQEFGLPLPREEI